MIIEKIAKANPLWGCSSAGRAPALQAGGHGFDSHHLHQPVVPAAEIDVTQTPSQSAEHEGEDRCGSKEARFERTRYTEN